MAEKRYYQGTGRRKTSIARVRLYQGTGEVMVNGKTAADYFGAREILHREMLRPLELTGNAAGMNVMVKVNGGGVVGQAGAVASRRGTRVAGHGRRAAADAAAGWAADA